jgi:hypothetical protein
MIDAPTLPLGHPDRGIECEMAAEDEYRALVNRIEAAGWTGDESAATPLSMALIYIRFRRETAADEARISEARKRACQLDQQ